MLFRSNIESKVSRRKNRGWFRSRDIYIKLGKVIINLVFICIFGFIYLVNMGV